MTLHYLENADSCSHNITILTTPIIYFISGLLICIVQLIILGILKRSRHLASKGDKQASNILVLPIYYIAVLYLAILGIIVGLDDMFGFNNRQVEVVILKWGLYRICSESLAIFLTHNGIGLKSLRRSLRIGISWAVFSSILPLIMYFSIGWLGYLISLTSLIFLLSFFYFFMWLSPKNLIHRRPALKSYSKYYSFSLLFFGFAHIFLYFRESLDVPCLTEIMLLLSDLFQPLVVFYAMHRDSQFWQGLATPDVNISSNLNEPLLGVWELGRETIGVVGESIAVLETHTVPIIPFGVLQIDTSGYFPGGSARVYKGILHQDKVAVKILFCIELTPDRVKSFCQEASMLHSLAHPNIVHCHGVAVMPPAICLVTEWCHHGSLYDLLHTSEYYIRNSSVGRPSTSSNKRSTSRPISQGRLSFNIRMSTQETQSSCDDDHISDIPQDNNINTSSYQLEDIHENEELENGNGNGTINGNNNNNNNGNNIDRKSLSNNVTRVSFRINSSNIPLDGRSSFSTSDLRVVSKKFHSTSRSSLPSLRLNVFEGNTPKYDEDVDDCDENEISKKGNENGTDMVEEDIENSLANTKSNRNVIKKLKSAASVMQSSLMGFGFGSTPERKLQTPATDKSGVTTQKDSKSPGTLLVSSEPLNPTLGYCLPMELRIRMIRDCCAGVAFLHSKGLMHCDIKSLNFLVTSDFVVKLSDLGEARPYKGMTSMDRGKMPKNINWSAPEILVDNGNQLCELSDVWSLAVVAGEILTGEIPFDSPHCRQMKVETFVDALGNDLRPNLPSKLDDWIKETIFAGWSYDVEKRCSAEYMANRFNEKISEMS